MKCCKRAQGVPAGSWKSSLASDADLSQAVGGGGWDGHSWQLGDCEHSQEA